MNRRLKDSDVTWLYGPLFNSASADPLPTSKVATTADKLNIIPHLPKGKKPILKRRTLAEVLVRGLSKATHTIPDPDETREIDLIQAPLPKDASPDRLTLLRTTSDTNLLHPAGFTLTVDEEAATSGQHVKSAFRQPRSRVHSSSHADNSPTPGSSRSAGERHISFNTFVTQCIAIQPGEHVPGVFDEEEDEEDRPPADWDEALSIASSESHPRRLSRTNSHSPDLSERLTIAPIPPTMLKLKDEDPEGDEGGFVMGRGRGSQAAKENGHGRRAREGPVLVYAPPTGSDSVYAPRDLNHPGVVEADAAVFDYFDASEQQHRRHHHRYGSRHELPDGEITVGGRVRTHRNAVSNDSQSHNIDNDVGGQVLYSTRVLDRDHLLGVGGFDRRSDHTADSYPSLTAPFLAHFLPRYLACDIWDGRTTRSDSRAYVFCFFPQREGEEQLREHRCQCREYRRWQWMWHGRQPGREP